MTSAVRFHNGPKRVDPVPRFWAKVDKSGDCWIWTATKSDGYGIFYPTREGHIGAHRYAYQLLVGQIPKGLQLDHLCRNRACVNPDHLEPVTNRENALRGETIPARNAAKTHCVNGHEFDPANTYIRPDGTRECRSCDRERKRRKHV